MNTNKPWYVSKTIWAANITIATSVAALFGLPAQMIDSTATADTVVQLITAVMGLVALHGRLIASEKIS